MGYEEGTEQKGTKARRHEGTQQKEGTEARRHLGPHPTSCLRASVPRYPYNQTVKNIGILVFVLIVGMQVIGSLLEKHNKKQQQKRLKEAGAAPKRRPALEATRPSRPVDRRETLAARRRTQLEELRSRGQGRTIQTRPPPTAAPPSPPRPVFPQTASSPFPTARPAPPKPAPRPRPAARPVPAPARPARLRVPPPRLPQPPQEEKVHTLVSAPLGSAAPDEHYEIHERKPHPLFSSFATETNPAQLFRRMMVLKELLEPPVSLRERDVWDRL